MTRRGQRLLVAALSVWAMVGHAGEARDGDSSAPVSSHDRMVALLREVAARTAEDHPLLSEAQLEAVKKKIAELPPDTPAGRLLPLVLQRGELALRQNRIDEAIPDFERVARETEAAFASGKVDVRSVAHATYRLGVAYLRMGETQNCCLRGAPESCIAPLEGRAIHTKREGSEHAIRAFSRVLAITPSDSDVHLDAQWLLNVAHMTIGDYPDGVPERDRLPASAFASPVPFPRFPNRAPDLGLDTFDLAGGAVLDDFDGDGFLDILASTFDPGEPLRYFHNERNGAFAKRTDEANLSGILGGFNLVQADYDNDGDQDVLVLRGAWLGRTGQVPKSLLRNDGKGRFTDVTFDAGIAEPATPSQTAAWADYDGDGDLDLFVGSEAVLGFEPPCQLWRNKGDGTFEEVAQAAGVQNFRFAKGVSWGDYDEDGKIDLYVSNLGQHNRLYRNKGDGTFEDVAQALGVTGPERSFVPWFWDFDNDGHLDLFVANYDWSEGGLAAVVRSTLGHPDPADRPALYRGDGKGGFVDVAASHGLTETILPMGANFGDLDGDGWLDFYLGTGYPDYEGLVPNRMFRNDEGQRFVDVTYAGGFGHLQKGHGVAFGDLDNDGDQDVFEQMGGFFLGDRYGNVLFENPGFGQRWIAIELSGTRSNRSGIGSRVRIDFVDGEKSRSVWRWVPSTASFGGNPRRLNVGLGKATRITRVEVLWPGAKEPQTFDDVPRDRLVRITEGKADLEIIRLERVWLGGSGKKK